MVWGHKTSLWEQQAVRSNMYPSESKSRRSYMQGRISDLTLEQYKDISGNPHKVCGVVSSQIPALISQL